MSVHAVRAFDAHVCILDLNALLAEPVEQPKKQPRPAEVVRAANEATGVRVKEGRVHKVHPQQTRNDEGAQLKLREMLIPKKHKRAYEKIKFGQKRQKREARKMHDKREKLGASTETPIEI